MAELNPLPATCQTLSDKFHAARVTGAAHDAALAEVKAAAQAALPDMMAAGMQQIDAAAFFKQMHEISNNYWNVLDLHKQADKLRRERRFELPVQTRGPGGGGR